MQVKMTKPGSNRIHTVPAKEQKIYEKQGWSLFKQTKKSVKKKVDVIEEPKMDTVTDQINLDLDEEQS